MSHYRYLTFFLSNLNSAIVTICVGSAQRLFAAHEDVLCKSSYFAESCRAQFFETPGKRIDLPTEEPEVFSAVLEYLYKGDYSPKLSYDKKRAAWYLDDGEGGMAAGGESTVLQGGIGGAVLKDTVIYVCRLSFFFVSMDFSVKTNVYSSALLIVTTSLSFSVLL